MPREKPPDTPASRTCLVSHVASAGLEPTPDTAVSETINVIVIVAFENQIRIVSVVKTCLTEQVFVFKGMPYERQLKEKQIYKTLSICVELIKSDVNLKFRLKVSSSVI